jgi:hypothetical protein
VQLQHEVRLCQSAVMPKCGYADATMPARSAAMPAQSAAMPAQSAAPKNNYAICKIKCV